MVIRAAMNLVIMTKNMKIIMMVNTMMMDTTMADTTMMMDIIDDGFMNK